MKTTNIFVLAAIAAVAAGAASAQTSAFQNENRLEDKIEDLREAINDDLVREVDAFGNVGRAQGFTGSIAASASKLTGNSDETDIGVGGNFGFFDGLNGHDFAISYEYGKSAGVVDEESLMFGYDYTRNLNSNLYIYSKAIHALDLTAEAGDFERDTFIGAGLGYYIVNDANTVWSVAAGPGWRWAERAVTLEEVDSVAASIQSDFSYRLNDMTTMTNDTTVIWSEEDTSILNDLGLSVSMTDALALRTSILTEYNSEPGAGNKNSDNTFGVSLVYTFQ